MDNKDVPVQESPELLHSFNGSEAQCMSKSTFIMALVFVILLGITSGYVVVSNSTSSPSSPQASNITSSSQISKGIVVGSNDAKTFKDSTEGVLKNGGIDGEGQYHLVRPGGDSQDVYLTSSIVDLSAFIDKKIKVNGQTQAARKAGWLMDVGRVEVLE
ncbi:MAG: hypothetical protein A3F31_03760 [Candidatus Levybacteria bacterium RIFCSPHIGHO2_12_FULL_38_12]|nr:MAG: hypothetical protein A2770_02155 [Candidatus Levybacteria bacterium RIFCSPHIGHO2_01_FULL_38_12]OGH21881.1 MAG: hypothetical protein A3D75_00375 [Candidatus Levybacteria bacterium RIFCSPHIGHO2_02_FULL_37_18]OGH22813.1 MAG: hypothetical protein A3F31_03760 [Candidatus Levybacteria bacterium RIFCSPHIGHO2_12_FULL_38_12]OGH33538.1 MAG: hypothetical protein A3A47_01720 [Candidatus Levybacteria bacterium RIFCSPLOWO2_01_FULL_37_20]OGH44459.1 MAG: hypothetical protein A3J14_03410 [Candidatus Lev